MAWVKLESRYPRSHKFAEAGAVALALDVCGICYCRDNGTDGFIPDAHIGMLGPIPTPRKYAGLLVTAKRWERDDELKGWWIHDYLEFNPPDEAERAAASARSEKASNAAKAMWRKRRTGDAPSIASSSAQGLLGRCSDDAPLPSLTQASTSVGTSTVVPPSGSSPKHQPKERPAWLRGVS